MEFSIKIGGLEKQRSACVVTGVFTPRKLSPSASLIDRVSGGYLSGITRRGDMQGKAGSTLLLHNVPRIASERVLLVGLGREQEFNEQKYLDAVRAAVRALNETGVPEAVLSLAELPVKKRDIAWKILQTVLVAMDSTYRFDRLKSKHDEEKKPLGKLTLMVERSKLNQGEAALKQALAIAEGVKLTKDLGNLPPNICTPSYLAEQALQIA
ncbi:MAG: M17 family peptidase N-terminal domain-containing protein, partial [Burkholderiales bacterium]